MAFSFWDESKSLQGDEAAQSPFWKKRSAILLLRLGAGGSATEISVEFAWVPLSWFFLLPRSGVG